MSRLTFVAVDGLLGRFDHHVAFDADWEFVILHGPNGVGKTKLLEIIQAILGGQLERLLSIPFTRAELRFDDGSRLRVGSAQETLPGVGDEDADAAKPRLSVKLDAEGEDVPIFDVAPLPELPAHRLETLERSLPVERVSPDEWIDFSLGDRLTTRGVIERYASQLPPNFQVPTKQPAPYRAFIDAHPVHLIETQRLLTGHPQRVRRSFHASPITVMRYAQDLSEKLSRALAENSTTSQRLDRSFPRRVIGSPLPAVTDEQIRQRYAQQGELRDRLAAVSLLDAGEPDLPLPDRQLLDWERIVMWTYLDDAEEKLATFQFLLDRAQLLREIVNSRFLFKELVLDRDVGFRFVTEDGLDIGPAALSSGEQHELVLAYDLIFNVEQGCLVLIDEPEISLHISWQQQFLTDLVRIAQLQSLRFVVATHSPQIIHKWWGRAKTLFEDASA